MNVLFIVLITSLVVGVMIFKLKVFELFFKLSVKLIIGALALFVINIISGYLGLYIPINVFTSLFVGLLGIPGLVTLGIIQVFII